MRLRHIETMSFSQSEFTMYTHLIENYPHLSALKKNDVVLLRSRLGNQLIFVIGFAEVSAEHGVQQYLRSERLRLTSRAPWNPLMLQNYANQVGITLDGIKTFQEHLEAYAKAKAAARVKREKAKKKS